MLLRDAFFHHTFSLKLIFPYSPGGEGGEVENIYPCLYMEVHEQCTLKDEEVSKLTAHASQLHHEVVGLTAQTCRLEEENVQLKAKVSLLDDFEAGRLVLANQSLQGRYNQSN